MANLTTTHVIEIETGIGEPAFIPLTLGQELQTISVGKKGMWRIESARVLDVHAFLYFNGTNLFVQSADDRAPASVDGFGVGKTWTELLAPCIIEIGAARLRFRSLISPAQPRRRAPADDQDATRMRPRPPVQAAAPGGHRPPSPRPAAGAPPFVPQSAEPSSFSKDARPFKPGEFSHSAPQDESTRFAPLEATGSRPHLDEPLASNAPRPATMVMAPMQSSPPGMASMQSSPPGMASPEMAPTRMAPPMMRPAGMATPMMAGSGSMPPPMGSAPPMMGPPNPSGIPMPPGSSTYVGHAGAPPPKGSLQDYVATYKELSPPRRILLVLAPFCLIAAAYLLLFDDAPGAGPVAAGVDAGSESAVDASTNAARPVVPPSVTAPPPVAPPVATPVAPSCPPGFVPYSVPIDGQIPCVPNGTPMPPASGEAPTIPPPSTGTNSPPGANATTLERQAVDYVAVGNYAAAAQLYDQLAQQSPNNPVYPEAARILRAKADAGVR